jgi:hypothetical protein
MSDSIKSPEVFPFEFFISSKQHNNRPIHTSTKYPVPSKLKFNGRMRLSPREMGWNRFTPWRRRSITVAVVSVDTVSAAPGYERVDTTYLFGWSSMFPPSGSFDFQVPMVGAIAPELMDEKLKPEVATMLLLSSFRENNDPNSPINRLRSHK